MYVLIVQTGKYKGKRIKLAGSEVVIGRDEGAAVRIGSSEVSREHCRLTITEDGVLVRDLGSANGSLVDGERISTTEDVPLIPGSVLTIGPMTFQLVTAAERTARGPAVSGKKDDGFSDNVIANWLTDTDHGSGTGTGDTTIISVKDAPAPAAPPVPAPRPKKREFKTVAEEAADIIRRHQEMMAARDAERNSPEA